ncbi:hypothetical protein [Litchfieldia salsa]|uniref:Uncharacterized protein n=1 Tax=Litchfieldia salsa TaxID=930152 RepID=A0A1H0TCG2_9BACI|nr:hypothetical protein [Litchfieldia salsa]SDP51732.1 hypothetical protein SAMN05216565_103419 [Litchfieldia salsa]
MTEISKQTYIVMERYIEKNRQINKENREVIYLYENMIKTVNKQFALTNVLDISYKSSSTNFGVLYLHTNQGLFSYQLDSDPTDFIKKYNELKRSFSKR